MKFWVKIFRQSVLLFFVFINLAGVIIVEKSFDNSLRQSLESVIDKYKDIENNLYLNADYLIDVDVTNHRNLEKWVDIIIKGYTLNLNDEPYYIELYTDQNELILSDWKEEISDKRQEIELVKRGGKQFIIRKINHKRYVFVSGLINLKNTDFKLVLSKNIETVYLRRKEDYQYFLTVSMGITVILSAGMILISKKLTQPLVVLSEISKEIAMGDYSRRIIESGSDDEVGVLEMNFNKMVDVIEDNILELQNHNDSKQRFIDSLNHEIKTPITSIIGYSELLLKGKVDEEMQRQALLYINSEARRLSLLNSTLLKLTLIREEKSERECLSVLNVVQNATNALKYKLNSKGIRLKLSVEDIEICGDRNQIEVLLINLLDNACKASHEDGTIGITGTYSADEDCYVMRIRDYGIGMAKEDLKKIIEPFYMVDKARTRKDYGIGLGLALCNEICKKHQIEMMFESELGSGTEVILKFCRESIML